MKPFTKNELVGMGVILAVIGIITGYNLCLALRRSRDVQRQDDLGVISKALFEFYSDFGFFPPSENGKIKACKGDKFDLVAEELEKLDHLDQSLLFESLTTCEWGKDGLSDFSLFDGLTTYLFPIPTDPKQSEGIFYLYLSNTRRFQLYTFLEGKDKEDSYDAGVVKRNLACSEKGKICSFGKAYGVPLYQSIEEYEKELLKGK